MPTTSSGAGMPATSPPRSRRSTTPAGPGGARGSTRSTPCCPRSGRRPGAPGPAALGAYWHREGHHAEGREWTESALAHAAGLEDLLVARLHLAAGTVTWPTDAGRARRHWETSVRLCERLPVDRYLACSLALVAVTRIGDEERYTDALG